MDNIIFKTLSNGLTVCLIKKEDYVEKHAMLAIRAGSCSTRFKANDDIKNVPLGTAHFVEHKLFDKKHGNIFDSFAELGANVNAYTGLDITAYYFNCHNNFQKCLSLLAEMATTPYFTQKGVEKELGIIGSEITMYADDANWQAHFGMLGCLYKSHPARWQIAGSINDINDITADTLELFYNSFYTAENAILIAAGDIDEDSFFEQADKEFTLSNTPAAQCIFPIDNNIEKVYDKKYMHLATPVFSVGYKEQDFEMSPILRIITSKMLMNIIAGKGSVLFEKLYASNLCTNPLSIDYLCGNSFGVSVIAGTSQNPERLLSQLSCEINNYLNYGISEKQLQRIKLKCRGELEQNMDSLDFCCSFVADNFVKSIKTLDFFDKYDSINSDELMTRLKNHFKSDNLCMCEVVPF